MILFGEHAAVHGHAAIGLSLPETTTVHLLDRPAGAGWDLGEVPEEDRGAIATLVGRLRELMPELDRVGPCGVRIESDVPRSAGFGSSAALCAALVRAARAHAASHPSADGSSPGAPGARTDSTEDWSLAHELESLFHGTPSGIDTGLSLMEGTWAFQPRPSGLPAFERLPCPLPVLVVAAVPREESCGALVADLSRRLKAGEEDTVQSIDSLGSLAGAARDALRGQARDPAGLLAGLADQAMALLRALGLSVPGLDALLDAGKRAGALGGKLSGAGAGGAFFLVARDVRMAGEIALRVSEEASRRRIRMASPPRVLVGTAAAGTPPRGADRR